MTTKNIFKNIGLVLLGVAFCAVIFLFPSKDGKLGGVYYDAQYFVGDVYNGLSQVLMMSNGVIVAPLDSASATIDSLSINSGTAITKFSCATATWNPASMGTSTINESSVSTDIALTGAVMGDTCVGSLTSATTSDSSVGCSITGTATATIRLSNLGTSALDIATGTAKVCYTH